MNTKIISAIAIKLFAIYIVVSIILSIPVTIGTFVAMKSWSSDFSNSLFWPVLIIAVTIVVTIIIFKGLWKLGNSIIKDVSEINVTDNDFDIKAFENALFVFLGLFFSISAFVEIPNLTTSLWVRSESTTGLLLADYAWVLSIAAQLIIGLSLIKKPNQWLVFIRSIGLSKKSG